MTTHRRIVSALVALSIVGAVCGCRTGPICILRPIPHTFSVAEVAGQWIGFTASSTDLSRLDLRADGTGILTQAYTGATNVTTMRFKIQRWDIATNNVLTCIFSPGGADDSLKLAWPVKMICKVTGTQLEALLRNGEGGWKENIVFLREKDFDEKLRVLRQ